MTITSDPPRLAALTDDELVALHPAYPAEVLAEAERRDQQAAARRAARLRAAGPWREQAHAQYLAAETACRGHLLNRAGQAKGIDPWSLWSGPDARAMAYASYELAEFWQSHPRITATGYRRQERRQEEIYRDELDRDDRGGIRPPADPRPEGARGDRDRAGHPVPPAAPRAREAAGQGSARADAGRDPAVRLGCDPVSGTCRHPHRAGTSRQCPDCPLLSAAAPADAPRPWAPPPLPAPAAQVAVREPDAIVAAPRPSRRAERIDGDELLRYVRLYSGRYVAYPGDAGPTAVALWTGHAVARQRDSSGTGPLIWRSTPRLLATSACRGSGKSTLLDEILVLTGSRHGKLSKVTPLALARIVGKHHETAVLDEAKLIFGSGNASRELQGALLNGYTPRGTYAAGRGGAVMDLSVFGPVAYAAKDELIRDTNDTVGDLLDRSIRITLARSARPMPEFDEDAEDLGAMLCEALTAWTTQEEPALRAAAKQIAREDQDGAMSGLAPRALQIWRPLRAVARVAGGQWEADAEAAMRELSGQSAAAEARDAMAGLRDRFSALAAPPLPPAPAGAWDDDEDDL